MIVFRRWDEVRWGVGRGSVAIPLDRRAAAKAPTGPERLVVRLGGWVELQRVRLRGVIDPAWLADRRARAGRAEGRRPEPLAEPGD